MPREYWITYYAPNSWNTSIIIVSLSKLNWFYTGKALYRIHVKLKQPPRIPRYEERRMWHGELKWWQI